MEYSNSDVLREFAKEMNGQFIERIYWHSAKVNLVHKSWNIIFDNYTEHITSGNNNFEQRYTRIVAPFITSDNFTFEIYRKTLFSSIAIIFGSQDYEIENKEFDKSFVIKTNNEFKMKSFLNNKLLRAKIQNLDKVNLQISDRKGIWEEKLPENQLELSYFVQGQIDNIEMFTKLHSLFVEMIDQLLEINSIKAIS